MARAGRLYGPLIVPIFSPDKSILLQFLSAFGLCVQHRGKVFKIIHNRENEVCCLVLASLTRTWQVWPVSLKWIPLFLTRNLKYLCFHGIWPNLAFNLTGLSSTKRENCEILRVVLPSLKLIPLKIIDDLFIA